MNPRCQQCGGQIGAFVNPDEPICICELAKRWRDGYRTRKRGLWAFLSGVVLSGAGLILAMISSVKMIGAASSVKPKQPASFLAARQQFDAAHTTESVGRLMMALGGLFATFGFIALMVGCAMVYRKGDEVRWSDAFWPPPH